MKGNERKRRRHAREEGASWRLLLLVPLLMVLAWGLDAREAARLEKAEAEAKQTQAEAFTPEPGWEPSGLLEDPRYPDEGADTVEPEEDEAQKIEAALLEQGYISDKIPMPYDDQCVLRAACWEWNVDFCTMLGIYQLESMFNSDAVNGDHYGYGQLSQTYFPGTKDPVQNIRRSTQLVAEHMEKYGNLDAALCAYHDGHDTGERGYSRVVKSYIKIWKEALGE